MSPTNVAGPSCAGLRSEAAKLRLAIAEANDAVLILPMPTTSKGAPTLCMALIEIERHKHATCRADGTAPERKELRGSTKEPRWSRSGAGTARPSWEGLCKGTAGPIAELQAVSGGGPGLPEPSTGGAGSSQLRHLISIGGPGFVALTADGARLGCTELLIGEVGPSAVKETREQW